MKETLDTRTRLLLVSRRMFARQGYDATSLRSITRQAETNLGAVTYHFGSKEQLYKAVFESIWDPLLDNLRNVPPTAGTPLDRIELVVRVVFDRMAVIPECAPLLLRQVSQRDPLPAGSERGVKKIFGMLLSHVRAGQSDGSVVAGDPALLALSVMAQPLHVLSLRYKVAKGTADPRPEDAAFARTVESVVAFVRRGLESRQGAR